VTAGTTGGPPEGEVDVPVDHRRHVSDYFRLERWELPSTGGDEQPASLGGRAPIDGHQRGPGGGLRTGGLLTNLDSLGGFASGLAALPRWIVTTSLLATVSELDHVGPLRFRADVLRLGRSSVVTALDVVDEGADDRHVAAATMTCAILDPGVMELDFVRPFSLAMPPPQPDPSRPEEFFCLEPGKGPVTRLRLEDRLRNPWGILHGGAVAMLADEAACRAAVAYSPAAVLHYLRPVKVGPVEARCLVLGTRAGRTTVRIEIHDVGSDDRTVTVGSVTVLAV
jgi:uncharacterized protein (TIGR00369 family)